MELQMPHNYLRFMKTFGYILAGDGCEAAVVPKMAKYVHVFLDLVFYEPTHLLFTNLQLALACVVCVRKYYSLGKALHPTLLELYGAGTDDEKQKVQEAADLLWAKFQRISGKKPKEAAVAAPAASVKIPKMESTQKTSSLAE